MGSMKVHVLFRASKKSGKVDTTMTALGFAQLEWWALTNTTPSKFCLVIERDTGKVVYATEGTKDGFPKVRDSRKTYIGTCDEFGIPIEVVQSITDSRFDEEVQ